MLGNEKWWYVVPMTPRNKPVYGACNDIPTIGKHLVILDNDDHPSTSLLVYHIHDADLISKPREDGDDDEGKKTCGNAVLHISQTRIDLN